VQKNCRDREGEGESKGEWKGEKRESMGWYYCQFASTARLSWMTF